MSRFRFPLATVLRIRAGVARQEEQRLARLHALRMSLENNREVLRQAALTSRAEAQKSTQVGTTAAEVQLAGRLAQSLEDRTAAVQIALEVLAKRIDEQRQRWRLANREYEEVEHLRNDAESLWKITERRDEQKVQDELFLLRYSHPER